MEDTGKKTRGGRGRGAARGRGRGKGRGRGRGRGKAAVVVESEDEQMQDELDESGSAVKSIDDPLSLDKPLAGAKAASPNPVPIAMETSADAIVASAANKSPAAGSPLVDDKGAELRTKVPAAIDMEADISQLEAPIFTTISRGPPEPMTRLKWDHKVNLIGEKVLNPMIHCCDQCENVKPILIYGRMIPCKHVFCLKCGREEPIKSCPRCKDKVVRVEQSGLGTVFMCTHGGSRYGTTGCRRTYLSQRDLQAHINHRHVSLTATVEPKVYKYT